MNAKEYLEENGSYIIDTIAMRKFGMNVIRLMEEYAKLKLEEYKEKVDSKLYRDETRNKLVFLGANPELIDAIMEHKKESKT